MLAQGPANPRPGRKNGGAGGNARSPEREPMRSQPARKVLLAMLSPWIVEQDEDQGSTFNQEWEWKQ
jgi:hypothetical protein